MRLWNSGALSGIGIVVLMIQLRLEWIDPDFTDRVECERGWPAPLPDFKET
jgi:hypothetical protein